MNLENKFEKVIVRYPPSPTGKLHVGNMRTLIFNYLYMKKFNGEAILRIEDTNQARHDEEAEAYIRDSLSWLGMDWSQDFRQSDRKEIYTRYLEKLISEDKAYISEELHTPEVIAKAQEEGKTLRDEVIRFRNANKIIAFKDEVLGEISVDTTDLGDFVIAKSLTEPLYHFAVVVDDWLMKISHVIRGADHVPNTPRQILIQESLGAPRPTYIHLPLIVGTDGKKLGKRHGATGTLEYREMGYEPEAFLNFMAFIGWNPGTEQEVFLRDDLVSTFHVKGIQKGSAVFNIEKLEWFNRQHILGLDQETKFSRVKPYLENTVGYSDEKLIKVLPTIMERINKWPDVKTQSEEGDIVYFFDLPEYEAEAVVWKKGTREDAIRHLSSVKEFITKSTEDDFMTPDSAKAFIWGYAEEQGRGDVLWPLRFSLAGRGRSADPFTLMFVLGKEESLRRIDKAISGIS